MAVLHLFIRFELLSIFSHVCSAKKNESNNTIDKQRNWEKIVYYYSFIRLYCSGLYLALLCILLLIRSIFKDYFLQNNNIAYNLLISKFDCSFVVIIFTSNEMLIRRPIFVSS